MNVYYYFASDWFKEASIFLEAYQQERLKRQEEREEAEKAPIKQKLKKELEKLHKQRHKEVSHCACTEIPL